MNEGREEAITVAELARRLRGAVERIARGDWVEGEVASLRRAGSGHVYFVLKDEHEDAVVDCVMYRFNAQRARRHLVDGSRLQLFGRATVWAPRGRLQFVAEAARPAGRGASLIAFEQLKERLRGEGLFEAERKRGLPPSPRVIGLVTSAHGAALQDVVTVAFRRGSVRIVLSPALVQGEGAAASILRAVDQIERYPGLDVLIIGRGGGSGEDLMAFNDERVVRRVAAVVVPVVSAVGHEIDTTLTDLVADVRAATPSQAAELVVPDISVRRESVARLDAQARRAMRGRLREDGGLVERLRAELGDPRSVVAQKQQLLDDLHSRLERRARRVVTRDRTRFAQWYPRLLTHHPRSVVTRASAELGPLTERLRAASRLTVGGARARLTEAAAQLDALSPLKVLERGYAIATREDGRAIRDANDVGPGDPITVRVHRGTVDATVDRQREGS